MDMSASNTVEQGAVAPDLEDVHSSSNIQDTTQQKVDIINHMVVTAAVPENTSVDLECTSKVSTVSSPMEVQNHVLVCGPTDSLLSILQYGSGSGSSVSEDSEPDSVDLIQDSESTDSEWEDIQSNDDNVRIYRDNNRVSNSSSSETNESLDEDMEVGARGVVKPVPKKSAPVDGDLELDDLPPVPDLSKLTISVKTEDCIQMGIVSNVIDRLVTIESLPNTPAYDLDTLLFLDKGKVPLGYVYDVLGQVTSPIYVVRFNSKEEIESRGIAKGLPVYSAPNTEHTQFVFLKELMKMKGSDASWQGDGEVPTEFLDFSDDDLEVGRNKLHNPNEKTIRKKKRNSLEKYKLFETHMNLRNEVNSARYKVPEVIKPPPRQSLPKKSFKLYNQHPPYHVRPPHQAFHNYTPNFPIQPNFNMFSAPPPMFNMPVPQFPRMHFPPNLQFPPPTFASPLPPLPVHPQPPVPPGYPPGRFFMPVQHMQLPVCKPTAQMPKMVQNTGVVPKIRLPRKYTVPLESKQYGRNTTSRHSNQFMNGNRQNVPSTIGYQPNSTTCNETGSLNHPGDKLFKNS